MNELKVFVKEEFGSVRAVIHDGEPWFGASDIARALGYSDADDAVRRHCNYTKLFKPGEMPGLEIGPRGMHFIPESDVYALIFGSNLPSAQAFRAWVCEEVLPSIRKTGAYSVAPLPSNFPDRLKAASIILEFAGIVGNQMALSLDKLYRHETGQSALEAMGIQLVAPTKNRLLTPTEIGKTLGGKSARAINSLLLAHGYQKLDPATSQWVPTEEGAPYAVILDVGKRHSDGTPIRQSKWDASILEALRKYLDDDTNE